MTKRTRRQFTDEFKNQIVQLYLNGKSKTELVKEYKLGMSSVCRWIEQHEASGSFKEKDNRSEDENEILKLRKENEQLKMEVDILKQAALIIGRK